MSDRVVAEARRWLGTPYRHQAATREAGCDCLGLVRGVWRALYENEPEPVPSYGVDWRDEAGNLLLEAALKHLILQIREPMPGDVILFRLIRHRLPRHCGIMVSGGHFIHAQEHVGVVEAALSDAWQRRVAAVFAFPGQ